jgi:hypothetical protein
MNKKEFYEAPEWGLRVLMLERKPICTSGDEYGDDDAAGDERESRPIDGEF